MAKRVEYSLMTLEEVARYLRLTTHALYKMAEQGRIPAMKAGRVWRFRKSEIDQWMKNNVSKDE